LIGVAFVGLVVIQYVAARAARTLGGKSSRFVIVLRAVNLVALLAIMVWAAWTQFGR